MTTKMGTCVSLNDSPIETPECNVRTSAHSPKSVPISPWESYFPRFSNETFVVPDHN